jgi:hypothetical protein
MALPPSSAQRNSAALNGALMAVGLLAVVDNVVFHWLLGLHRLFDGPELVVFATEAVLVVLGIAMFGLGMFREGRARATLMEGPRAPPDAEGRRGRRAAGRPQPPAPSSRRRKAFFSTPVA